MIRIATLAALVCIMSLPSAAQDLRGQTMVGRIEIRDGDSFTFTPNDSDQVLEFRMFGVDAPEMRDAAPWGMMAREYFRFIASSRMDTHCLVIDSAGQTRSGKPRWATQCRLPPGMSIQVPADLPFAESMLRAGYAWQDTRFQRSGITDRYRDAESAARDARRGMWQIYDGP